METNTKNHQIKKIESIRAQIDQVDKKILELLNKRASFALEIGSLKKQHTLPVYDPSREKKIIQKIVDNSPGPLGENSISEIFRNVIHHCRELEQIKSGISSNNSNTKS